MEMKVFDQVYNELTLLQQEDKDDLEIAEQSLMAAMVFTCLLYTSPSPRDLSTSRMPSSA